MIASLVLYASIVIAYAIYAIFVAVSFATSVDAGWMLTSVVAMFSWLIMMAPVGLVCRAAQPLFFITGVVFEIIGWLAKKAFSAIRRRSLANRHSSKPA